MKEFQGPEIELSDESPEQEDPKVVFADVDEERTAKKRQKRLKQKAKKKAKQKEKKESSSEELAEEENSEEVKVAADAAKKKVRRKKRPKRKAVHETFRLTSLEFIECENLGQGQPCRCNHASHARNVQFEVRP